MRKVWDALEKAGHTITYKWTNDAHLWTWESAVDDIIGVQQADALICLFEKNLAYRGAWVEFGAALAFGKPIYVVGQAMDELCIFMLHPKVYHAAPAVDVFLRMIPTWRVAR